MTEYIIDEKTAIELKSALGLVCREAIESGMTNYADDLRDLMAKVDSRPTTDDVLVPRDTAEKMRVYFGEKIYGLEKYGDLSEDGDESGIDDNELAAVNGFADQMRGSLDR